MKILVINLTRMGDIILSLGLINGLRRTYPEAEIDYLAMSSFAGILKYFPHIHTIYTLDDIILIGDLSDRIWNGYLELASRLAELNRRDYDLLINAVPSGQTALLGYLIKAKKKEGMFVNQNRERTIGSNWTAYLLANKHGNGDHTFHLADIFAMIGRVRADAANFRLFAPPEALARADEIWRAQQLHGFTTIGFHIGASRSQKAWDPELFKAVIVRLCEARQYKIVLFGGYKEMPLKERFDDIRSDWFVNLIGTNDLGVLIGFFRHIDLLVTNDTGPMHIAAACQKPIVNLSLGPANVWETGPYGTQALILHANINCYPCPFDAPCHHQKCHQLITPEILEEVILAVMADQPEFTPSPDLKYYRAGQDIFGLQHNAPFFREALTRPDFLLECKRCVWAVCLVPDLDMTKNWLADYIAYLKTFYDLPAYDYRQEISCYEARAEQAMLLSQMYSQLSRMESVDQDSIDRIKTSWQQLQTIKEQLFLEAGNCLELYDFFDYAKFKEICLEGDGFAVQARESAKIYGTLYLQLKTLGQMIKMAYPTSQATEGRSSRPEYLA